MLPTQHHLIQRGAKFWWQREHVRFLPNARHDQDARNRKDNLLSVLEARGLDNTYSWSHAKRHGPKHLRPHCRNSLRLKRLEHVSRSLSILMMRWMMTDARYTISDEIWSEPSSFSWLGGGKEVYEIQGVYCRLGTRRSKLRQGNNFVKPRLSPARRLKHHLKYLK